MSNATLTAAIELTGIVSVKEIDAISMWSDKIDKLNILI